MQNLSKLANALLLSALISAPAFAAEPAKGKAFATVNGIAIQQSTADAFIAEQKTQGAQESPELKNAVREELVRRELLTQEAKKKGLDKRPAVAAQAELARQAIYIRAYIQDFVKANPVTDAQLKSDYETIKTQLGGTEYKTRHILVEKKKTPRRSLPTSRRASNLKSWPSSPRTPAPRKMAATSAGAAPPATSSRSVTHSANWKKASTPKCRSRLISAITSSCSKTAVR